MLSAVPALQDFLEHTAARLAEKEAITFESRERVTFAEVDRRANQLAHALVDLGIRRGDRVALFLENSVEYAVAFWAALKANAVVTPVNPLTKPDKLAYMLDDCRAKVLITSRTLSAVYEPVMPQRRHVAAMIAIGSPAGEQAQPAGWPRVLSWSEAVRDGIEGPPKRLILDVDLAAIIYTSGSTGDPKGVMLTHRNMLTAGMSVSTYLGMRESDVVMCALPLTFDYGLYQMLMSARVGARLVLETSFAMPQITLKRVVDEGVTGFPGVPTMFALITEMRRLERFDFSKVRYVSNTAAALSEPLITALRRTFSASQVFSMYGLTECKRCTYLPPEDIDRKPSSVGVAIPNTELWIVDEEGREVAAGTVGQLVIRGATVMKGYWEKPAETAKKLRPGPIPNEVVLYTGDYCRRDEEGYLYFVGRMDDIIKCRGEKVAPKEVEMAISHAAGVKECAVIGVPDAVLGQAIKALVVAREGESIDTREVIAVARARLEDYKVPKYVEVVASLPRTNTGKIKKTDLN